MLYYVLRHGLNRLRVLLARHTLKQVQKVFEAAPETPAWLEPDTLEVLQNSYAYPPPYGYDPQSLEQRGRYRAEIILRLIHARPNAAITFLELGCGDGMTSCCLQRRGNITVAIDSRSDGFDRRAVSAGTVFYRMDASRLAFNDDRFDCIFSFNAFEHFAAPEAVLQELIRVVKVGGYLYLDFGPLYMAPLGLHAYRSITVPYCQFLFEKKTVENFARERGLDPVDYSYVNAYPAEAFRGIWSRARDRLETIRYHESTDLSGLILIRKYPSCFKSKTADFDNLITSSMAVLFRKIR